MAEESNDAKAEAIKNEGNELFKQAHYKDALEKYNAAIDLNPEVPTYYCNRAFCHTRMENHGLAIEDAGVALELDKQCAKGYYRRAASYMAMGKYKKALTDYKSLKQLKPNDKDVHEKFKACEKEVKREAF
jgi:serine/threonine-protein phosphatase 5